MTVLQDSALRRTRPHFRLVKISGWVQFKLLAAACSRNVTGLTTTLPLNQIPYGALHGKEAVVTGKPENPR